MSWVLSMAVVDGLSAQQIAGRLEAELGEETTSDSPSGEEAGAGPGLPAVGIHDFDLQGLDAQHPHHPCRIHPAVSAFELP